MDPIIDVCVNILVEGGETYYDLRHRCIESHLKRGRNNILSEVEKHSKKSKTGRQVIVESQMGTIYKYLASKWKLSV